MELTEKKRTARRIWRRVILLVFIVLLLLGALPSAALTVFLHRHIDYRGEETAKRPLKGVYTADEFGLAESETVHRFGTADGETVWCSEIRAEEPKGVIIYLTGIVQPSVTYFYGHAAWMRENGYASFLLEVRSHGESTGKLIGLGYTETEDVRAVLTYIAEREEYDGLPVILQGVSMGGAAALCAFGQLPEIDACIAMSPYASFETQIDLLLAQMKVPKFIRRPELLLLRQTLKWNFGSGAVESVSPEKQIQNAAGRPVLLIACSGDTSVPAENTAILQRACPDAEVWIRDSWEHFIVKGCDFRRVAEDTEYCGRILAFIRRTA